MRRLSKKEVLLKEPYLKNVHAALESPESGIVDSHAWMQYLEGVMLSGSEQWEGHLALGHQVEGILYDCRKERYEVRLKRRSSNDAQEMMIHCRTVVNSGGLWADKVAELLQNEDGTRLPSSLLRSFQIHPCKGYYYTYQPNRSPRSNQPLISRLVYPLPPDRHLTRSITIRSFCGCDSFLSLGIHCTVDLAGRLRLGPDTEYVSRRDDYSVNEDSNVEKLRKDKFWAAVSRYVDLGDRETYGARMKVDYAGIRYYHHWEG
jgi:L-2-hydroxyglutarate oxidase LhgO